MRPHAVAVYTRAAASDYDDWETVHGKRGWGSADLLPLLRKVRPSLLPSLSLSDPISSCSRYAHPAQCETYKIAPGKPTHGYSGPLKVSYGGLITEIGRDFLDVDVARAYDKTRGHTDDVNGLRAVRVQVLPR